MKLCSIFAIVLFAGLSTIAVAQDTEEAPIAGIQKAEAPAHLGDEAPNLTIDSDLESGNLLVAGFSLGAAYDTRGLYNSGVTPTYSGDTRYFIQPSIALQRTYSTAGYTVSYTPGVSISQHDTGDNQYTQNVSGEFSWKPSSYWLLHARQDYSLTDNPFESVGRVDLLPGLGGPFGPNYDGVLPDTKRTSLVSGADVTYRLAEHSAFGLTGGFQKYDFDSDASGVTPLSFVNSEVVTGSAFFSQELSSSLTAGVQVALMDIYSTGAQVSRTQAPSAMLFLKLQPDSHVTLTLYGGPEYARSRDVVANGIGSDVVFQHSWHPTAGGSFVWSARRHAIELEAMRRLANGGGVMDAVQATYAAAGYRVRLMPRLLANLRANWSDQTAIGLLSAGDSFRSVWAGGGPVVELNHSFGLRFDLAYVHQSETGIGIAPGNHFLAQASLDYRFHKSLGD